MTSEEIALYTLGTVSMIFGAWLHFSFGVVLIVLGINTILFGMMETFET